MSEQQLAEALASMLNRYMALTDLDGEQLLKWLESQLESWGYQCIDGVWQKAN